MNLPQHAPRRRLTQSLLVATVMPSAWVGASSAHASTMTPLDWAELVNGLRQGLAHRLHSPAEQALLAELRTLANDWSRIAPLVQREPIDVGVVEQALVARMHAARALAQQRLGDRSSAIVMAQNACILMSYDALVRHNPSFFWSQLGIFAANEVRANLALAFTLQATLEGMQARSPRLAKAELLPGMSLTQAIAMTQQATQDLIDGQSRVLANIGSLALLHKQHGALPLTRLALSEPARQGFLIQAQADSALQRQQWQRHRDLSTDAAIQFGIHEQANALQEMWDRPSMKGMAQLNDRILQLSLENIGMRGDLFIGTNKMLPFVGPYLIIRAPFGATDLSSLQDRIAIAVNGFRTLNDWRSNLALNAWITQSRTRLGRGEGLYRPAIMD